jgi:hypothetical protein
MHDRLKCFELIIASNNFSNFSEKDLLKISEQVKRYKPKQIISIFYPELSVKPSDNQDTPYRGYQILYQHPTHGNLLPPTSNRNLQSTPPNRRPAQSWAQYYDRLERVQDIDSSVGITKNITNSNKCYIFTGIDNISLCLVHKHFCERCLPNKCCNCLNPTDFHSENL